MLLSLEYYHFKYSETQKILICLVHVDIFYIIYLTSLVPRSFEGEEKCLVPIARACANYPKKTWGDTKGCMLSPPFRGSRLRHPGFFGGNSGNDTDYMHVYKKIVTLKNTFCYSNGTCVLISINYIVAQSFKPIIIFVFYMYAWAMVV